MKKNRIRAHELLYVLEGNSYGMDDLNATNVEANHWQCNHCNFQTYSGKQVNFLHPWHNFFLMQNIYKKYLKIFTKNVNKNFVLLFKLKN